MTRPTIEDRLEQLVADDARSRSLGNLTLPTTRQGGSRTVLALVGGLIVILALAVAVLPRSATSIAGAPSPQSTPREVTPGGAPVVSADGKTVVDDRRQELLLVDDDQVVEWFRTQSQLCDAYNITTRPDRRAFCTDKAAFKANARFTSAAGSPNGAALGFTIATDTLAPDSVAGIFLRSTGKIQFLTNYNLSNQFIGFSPNGESFVYQGGCFEGNCSLFVRDSATLALKASVNTGADRGQTVMFVRWLSDGAFEYKQYTQVFQAPGATPGPGPELKTASLSPAGCAPVEAGTLQVCPGVAAIGSTISISGRGCAPGAGTSVVFIFVMDDRGPVAGPIRGISLPPIQPAADGSFTVTFTIPATMDTYHGPGSGPTTPGIYRLLSKPFICASDVTVVR